jgi:putative Mg2+ transporter-C (MgtC) family protein
VIILPDEIVKLLLALLLGGMIGLEREFRDKAAGFRTVIFICLGAALFTLVAQNFSPGGDSAPIAAQIVTGVGFLGAGAILRERGRIVGLTTAAIIWMAAAIGMSVGAGLYLLAVFTTAITLLVLWAFPLIEDWIDRVHGERIYEVVCANTPRAYAAVERLFIASEMRVRGSRKNKKGKEVVSQWHVKGSPGGHHQLVDRLLASADVKEFSF